MAQNPCAACFVRVATPGHRFCYGCHRNRKQQMPPLLRQNAQMPLTFVVHRRPTHGMIQLSVQQPVAIMQQPVYGWCSAPINHSFCRKPVTYISRRTGKPAPGCCSAHSAIALAYGFTAPQ